MKNILICGVSVMLLIGCAGSASHKVVLNNHAADQNLSCQEADAEIMRAQTIINGVNDDKSDVSGADVMDGLLWFPFNLIAKSSNYANALNAANQRILLMKQIKADKKCSEQDGLVLAEKQKDLDKKIRELNLLYKDGMITESEYVEQKKKVLDNTN